MLFEKKLIIPEWGQLFRDEPCLASGIDTIAGLCAGVEIADLKHIVFDGFGCAVRTVVGVVYDLADGVLA